MNSWADGRHDTSRLSCFQPLLNDEIGDGRVIGTPRDVVGHLASRGISHNVSIMSAKFQLMTMDGLMRRAVEFLVLYKWTATLDLILCWRTEKMFKASRNSNASQAFREAVADEGSNWGRIKGQKEIRREFEK